MLYSFYLVRDGILLIFFSWKFKVREFSKVMSVASMLNPLCQLHVHVQCISCPHVHAVVFLFGMNFPLFYFRQEIKINANLPFSYRPIWQVLKGEGEGRHLLH